MAIIGSMLWSGGTDRYPPNRMLKNSFLRRLLKKVQMQGGVRRAE
jgi:hypothetical protein